MLDKERARGGVEAKRVVRLNPAAAELLVVEVSVDHEFEGASGLLHQKVGRGTRNFVYEPAMTPEQAEQGVLVGAKTVLEGPVCDLVALGEVGIGNTTSAAALLALLLNVEATEVVGSGTGLGSEGGRRKVKVVQRALDRCRGRQPDPLHALSEVGGFEIAALVGAILAAASRRIPVFLDGFITGVAALIAVELSPAAHGYLIASHRSAERGHTLVLERLGLKPLLELDLRLGEGSGAALAFSLAESACRVLRDVRTFREPGPTSPSITERLIRPILGDFGVISSRLPKATPAKVFG